MLCTPSLGQKIFNGVYIVVDALAVLIIVTYVLYTPSMSEMTFIGVYLVIDALAIRISIPYVIYKFSEIGKILNVV